MPGCGHSRLRAWRDAAAVTDPSRAGVERLLAQHGKGLDVEVPRFAGALALFNSAYRVINARKQCVMAARVMGASRWQMFKDVLVWLLSVNGVHPSLREAVVWKRCCRKGNATEPLVATRNGCATVAHADMRGLVTSR